MVNGSDVKDGKSGKLLGGFGLCADGTAHPAEASGVALVGGADPREYAAQMAAIRERMLADAGDDDVSHVELNAA